MKEGNVMSKRVFNNGKSIRVPFSNDMDKNGAEYNMDKVSHLLDEKISLDQLKQELKKDDMKNSRKRPTTDELKYTKHYHPNESVEIDHLFNLDQSYGFKKNGLEYTKKHHSYRKLKDNEVKNEDGIILKTSAGTVQLNNKIAEKFAHGKKRLKISNKYVTNDKLLNFSDDEAQITYGFANNTQSEKTTIQQSNLFTIGNTLNKENTIAIPIRNHSINNRKPHTIGIFNYSKDNLANANLKKQYPYGEIAMPSNGKTVVEGNYDSYIDWDKTICTKFGDNIDYVIDFDNQEDNLIVPEKYYQTNHNVPRTADEWEYKASLGDERCKEDLPNANIVSNDECRNALTSIDEENLLKPLIKKEGNIMSNETMNYKIDNDSIYTVASNVPHQPVNNMLTLDKLIQEGIIDKSKIPTNNNVFTTNQIPTRKLNDIKSNDKSFWTIVDNITDESHNKKFSIQDEDLYKLSKSLNTNDKVPDEVMQIISQQQENMNTANATYSITSATPYTIDFDKGDNMNKVITFQDDEEFRPVGGNGVNYSPRMHKEPTIFNQKAVHQTAIEQFGPNPVNNFQSSAPNAIAEAKEHAGMTASIALSLKLRDLKVKITEFAKNVNKVDHSIYDAMNNTVFNMLRNVAKIKRRTHHKTTIYELDADCEFMRDLIKTAVQLQYLSPKKGLYNAIVSLTDEIGSLIGGFIKHMKTYEGKK